jgi:hypothetical protein
MRKVLSATKFISIFDDEVIAIDNNSWVGIHAYVLKRLKQMLTLEKVTTCAYTTNLTQLLLRALLSFDCMDVQVVG